VDDLLGVPIQISMYANCYINKVTHFLFLASPEKANWFSGLPSGIL
jgi:hypothetical protein